MEKKDTPINSQKMADFENELRATKNESSDSRMIIIGVIVSVPVILIMVLGLVCAEGMTH